MRFNKRKMQILKKTFEIFECKFNKVENEAKKRSLIKYCFSLNNLINTCSGNTFSKKMRAVLKGKVNLISSFAQCYFSVFCCSVQ